MSSQQITELFSLTYIAYDTSGMITDISKCASSLFNLSENDNLNDAPHLKLLNENYETQSTRKVFVCASEPFSSEVGVSVDNSTVTWMKLDFVPKEAMTYVRFSPIEELIAIRRLNKQLAIQDPHTGLLYRDAFVNRIKDVGGYGTMCCVRICNYQRISEVWNIGVANLVFMEVLSRFQIEFEDATFSKYSTDCFSAFVPIEHAFNIEHLYNELNAPFNFNGNSFYSNVALGYYREKEHDDHEISLNKAEMATFDVLSEKLRLVEFQDALAKQIEWQNKIETELRASMQIEALKNDFHIAFQPIHDTSTECLIGAECLMRWSMGGKPVSPATFIPIIESSGEINKLTLFTLSQIRRLLSELDTEAIDSGFYLFSINISVIEILDINFEKKLLSTLAEYHLSPNKIKLELTESALIDNFNYVNEVLMSLQRHGFIISLDDFGTGFSSLSYLCKLNFDEIKIDRSFVTNVVKDDRLQSVFNSIVSLAKNLDKPIVAEGVEDMEQMIYAKAKGVEYIQGYHYSKPLPLEEFISYVVADKSSYLHFDS
ncbi:diguanylate cyclase [Pseudoalteromonas sp. MSK9-3]|uniref:bifunctional diguanylate cyclase/phosphodiesterase n=1 Tax=Pseudoalteromonas sp. MSK9-3 TaxID=1897633 RepID=UPI000E6B52F0|nr:bifunctional diguanylate cyclase/phosphodiesterase [Pseudoalteromonas sp. MSK9-3]RJE70755.1 diguanylate cyclase [Pseudoalteromonas sp. MSK9-3]